MVEAVDLSRRFGDRLAVDGVTFSVAAGEVLAWLGPNGAGKTTTLRMLAGLLPPSAGRASVAGIQLGTDPEAQAVRARVGLLTETPGLWDRLSVWTNLITYARLHGVVDPAGAVRRVLDRLQMADRAHDAAAVLSKGLRQRVALARALLHAPSVLLLDEPTSGLDPASAKDVRDIVAGLRREGAAVLICTHNLAEAEQVADRVGIVKTRLLALGTPQELRGSGGSGTTVVVDVDGDASRWRDAISRLCEEVAASGGQIRARLASRVVVPDVVAALVQAGARIDAVQTERPSLEQVYLSLVGAA